MNVSREKREKWIQFIHSLYPEAEPEMIQVMDEIRMVGHLLTQIRESSMDDTGLSYAQYRILLSLLFVEEIEKRVALSPSEISERQGTSRNTISSLIRQLESSKLIERRLDQNDRRKFKICLTDDGRQMAKMHAANHLETMVGCFSRLNRDEQKQLSQLLAKVSQEKNE